jgi:SAM-dependent methyltransferase
VTTPAQLLPGVPPAEEAPDGKDRAVSGITALAQRDASHWWVGGIHRVTWALLATMPRDCLSVTGAMAAPPLRSARTTPGHTLPYQFENVLGSLREGTGPRVLDAGCGPGWDLAALPVGFFGVGLDRTVIAPGSQAVEGRLTPLVRGDAEQLPFGGHAFDLVLALDLLEQTNLRPDRVLDEAYRALRPGGWLLARVPAQPWLYGPHDRAFGGARRYRKQKLGAIIEAAGFSISRLTYANTLLFPAEAIGRLMQRAGIIGGDDLRPVPEFVNRCLASILTLEAHWLMTHDLPFGLSLLCLAKRPA